MASMKYDRRLHDLLAEAGAVETRTRKHFVYRLANGRNFVRPATPSDRRTVHNAISDLKRTMCLSPVQAPEELAPVAQPRHRRRMRLANSPASQLGEVALPKIDSPVSGTTEDDRECYPADSIFELRDQLGRVPAFWELGVCGRTRVLMKAISASLPGATIEMLSVSFCRAELGETAMAMTGTPFRTKEQPQILVSGHLPNASGQATCSCGMQHGKLHQERMSRIWDRCYESTPGFAPALLLDDPCEGYVYVVESYALRQVTGRWDDILIVPTTVTRHGLLNLTAPLWNTSDFDTLDEFAESGIRPDAELYLLGMTEKTARQLKTHFTQDAEWTNPKSIRTAIHQLQQVQRQVGVQHVDSPVAVAAQEELSH